MVCGCAASDESKQKKKVRRPRKSAGKRKLRAAIPKSLDEARAAKRKVYTSKAGRHYILRKGRKVYLK